MDWFSSLSQQLMGFLQNTMNGFGSLQWNVEDLTTSTTFLDLTIQIIDHKIHTSTFQKDINLYLYIPPTSAHPTSCFKGLIIGGILCYCNQNSSQHDFITITNNFISHLFQWGHLLKDLIPILRVAAATIDKINHNTQEHSNCNKLDESLFIHWQLYPKDINKAKIHQTYNTTLKGHDNFAQMRITMSRPKNLRDHLCQASLPLVPNHNTSDTLEKILNQQNNTTFNTDT